MPQPYIPGFSQPDRNRRVLLVRRPKGVPQPEDFIFDSTPVPSPADGGILVRNIYLSVDPAQRGWAADTANYSAPVELGTPMRSLAVGRVVASKAEGFIAGDFVYGFMGWQDYALAKPSQILSRIREPAAPLSAYAGILGINGITAWLALKTLGSPARGETIVVSTAAGAVGSIVGQLAKIAGCRTIGLTSSEGKVHRCLEGFGYDVVLNYKEANLREALARAAGAAVDIYFDNVGGAILDLAIRLMATAGRIIQCGTASISDWSAAPQGLRNDREILTRRLICSGFVVFDHVGKFDEVQKELVSLIDAGMLAYDEDISHGIDTAPNALQLVYSGANTGKKL